MWTCPKCREEIEPTFEVCWNCGTAQDGTEDPSFRQDEDQPATEPAQAADIAAGDEYPLQPAATELPGEVLVTTTPTIDGKRIIRYCGIVTGEAILRKDYFESITDAIFGSGTAGYSGALRKAREDALAQLQQAALKLRANAVVGVALNYGTVGEKNNMLMVSICGTAVVAEQA